jgi:hypothetical protein
MDPTFPPLVSSSLICVPLVCSTLWLIGLGKKYPMHPVITGRYILGSLPIANIAAQKEIANKEIIVWINNKALLYKNFLKVYSSVYALGIILHYL